MQGWTLLSDPLTATLIAGVTLAATVLLAAEDEGDEEALWGDDPHVLAMLSGMSL